MNLEAQIEQAARIIAAGQYVVSVTGAGHSTPSGIPDFRSPESGLWQSVNPMEVASIFGFRQRPESFFEWVRPLVQTVLDAAPNPAHYALADLEAVDRMKAVITQNIDGLHQRAGSKQVLEVHGHVRQATCIRCYRVEPLEAYLPAFLADGQIPRCPACNGILKPNVILFGEQLPVSVLNAAWREVRACDVVLVAGTSLQVAPASDLPRTALAHGARAVVVNYEPTDLDPLAHVVIHDDVSSVLPRIAALCRRYLA
ncbi:MAG: NAD-dependent protein deacylase [Chloroflexota bacterium]